MWKHNNYTQNHDSRLPQSIHWRSERKYKGRPADTDLRRKVESYLTKGEYICRDRQTVRLLRWHGCQGKETPRNRLR